MCKRLYKNITCFIFSIGLFLIPLYHTKAQVLKSIVYDFDGLDIGASALPEGDYYSGDLAPSVAASPLPPNDMIGDRCLQLNLNWNLGTGAFGRGTSRYIEFDANQDVVSFYFFNPAANNQTANFELILGDDDNGSNAFEGGADDTWKKSFSIPATSGWQLFSVPLKDLTDGNAGGNGAIDMAFTGNAGMLLFVEFKFTPSPGATNASFYLDMIAFSEGSLPRGASDLELPYKSPNDYCLLGAYSHEQIGEYHLTPAKFESLFPPAEGKKLRYVNTFIHWAHGSSTTPSEMPRQSAQILLNNRYTPVLTWEPLYSGYARLDPVQPRLQNILNGEFNGYIDAFADDVKKLSDTVIIRLMHEFEGDWYPWSIVHNDKDPGRYIAAFRFIVDRFRARGANNVKWMWCVNSDYAPYEYYNWFVKAYPGDSYVDIVATDIYNNHFPVALPWWRSFRWQTTESYYYLTKYFPNKTLFICEVGVRERFSSENPASESKGAWYARMDKELQSNFRKSRALIFFNAAPDQNWIVNSSPFALQSLTENIWNDPYYFKNINLPVGAVTQEESSDLFVFPNPSDGKIAIGYVSGSLKDSYSLRIIDSYGKLMFYGASDVVSGSFSTHMDLSAWPRGIYYAELRANHHDEPNKKGIRQVRRIVKL